MKRRSIAILSLWLGVAYGQPVQPHPAPPPASAQTTSTRSSFDPIAQGNRTRQPCGIVEITLAGVNPHDKDYGVVVADWRKTVFEATVERVYLWSVVLLSFALGSSLLANGWFFRERERRLTVSANIVVQLFNAYIGSRSKAFEAIAKHNALVERYNRLNDETQALRPQLDGNGFEQKSSQVDYGAATQDKAVQPNTAVEVSSLRAKGGAEVGAELSEVELLRTQLKDFETRMQRKEAQLQAKENLITNLRSRLTRAHDSLEGQRQPKSEAK